MKFLLPTLAALTLCMAVGCAPEDPCADRGDMAAGDAGLDVTETEHAAGWGSDQCLQCHALETTHRVNCTSIEELDLDGVREQAAEGNDACRDCHGDNGIEGA